MISLTTPVPKTWQRRLLFDELFAGCPVWEAEQKDEAVGGDLEARERLRDLRARIETKLGQGHCRHYQAAWTGSGVSTDHLHQFCIDVLADLTSVIESEIRKLTDEDPLDTEIRAHREFGEERGRKHPFKGRENMLGRIGSHIVSGANHPLILFGPAGTGKTALLARAVELAEEQVPGAVTIRRFIGATPASVDCRSLLRSLCQELGRQYDNDAAVSLDYRELVSEFRQRLSWATAEKPLLLFLDAVDQFAETDPGRSMVWLPAPMPPQVHVVVSALEYPTDAIQVPSSTNNRVDPLSILRRRLPGEFFVPLDDLTGQDTRQLLENWLRIDPRRERRLQSDQWQTVLSACERCPRPLFLQLASEEARLWNSEDAARMPGESTPDAMLDALIGQLFDRLSESVNHGPLLVERTLGYLIASRNGLSGDELIGVLSSDEEFFQSFKTARKRLASHCRRVSAPSRGSLGASLLGSRALPYQSPDGRHHVAGLLSPQPGTIRPRSLSARRSC